MVHYLLLCAVSVLAGRGIQRLIRLPAGTPAAILLSPVLALAFWSLGFAVILRTGHSVGQAAPFLWIATLLLALAGTTKTTLREIAAHPFEIAQVVLLPVLLLVPYFVYGITDFRGSWFWDGPHYVREGLVVWNYPMQVSGQAAPVFWINPMLFQFVSPGLLAFFSTLTTAGDPQTSTGLFLVWSVFAYASSVAFFFYSKLYGSFPHLWRTYIWFAVFAGWILNVVMANNFGNLLLLCIIPAVCGLDYGPEAKRLSTSVAAALLCSTALYSYPQLAPIVILALFVMWLEALVTHRDRRANSAVMLLVTFAFTLALMWPWRSELFTFFRMNLIAGTASKGNRPGESYFLSLFQANYSLSTFWGFLAAYQRHLPSVWKILTMVLSICMTAASMVGIYILLKRRAYGLLALACVALLGMADMIFVAHYDYGAYKFINTFWWLFSLLAVLAMGAGRRALVPWRIVFTCVWIAVCVRIYAFSQSVHPKSMQMYREVQNISQVTHASTVAVNIDDPAANDWSVYYLRGLPIYLVGGHGPYYSPDAIMSFVHSVALSDASYVLTDDPHAFERPAVWSSPPFYLWPVADEALLFRADCQDAVTLSPRPSFTWPQDFPATFSIWSPRDGRVHLEAQLQNADRLDRALDCIELVNGGYRGTIPCNRAGLYAGDVPVTGGVNKITLRCLGPSSRSAASDPDKGTPRLAVVRWSLRVSSPHG